MGNVSKLPANDFKWVKQKQLSKFNEGFIKKYDENSNTGFFLEVDIEYPKMLFNSHKDSPFPPERKKNLFVVQNTKKNVLFT